MLVHSSMQSHVGWLFFNTNNQGHCPHRNRQMICKWYANDKHLICKWYANKCKWYANDMQIYEILKIYSYANLMYLPFAFVWIFPFFNSEVTIIPLKQLVLFLLWFKLSFRFMLLRWPLNCFLPRPIRFYCWLTIIERCSPSDGSLKANELFPVFQTTL